MKLLRLDVLSLGQILTFFLIGHSLVFEQDLFANEWRELKGAHFIVNFEDDQDSSLADKVLKKAEGYYHSIAEHLGYSRYSNFWTWEERVKIIIFKDRSAFLRSTGQPRWSLGYAFSHAGFTDTRVIVTFKQQNNFLEGVLPHEITHLILRDFIGSSDPWFDEGVAQYFEAHKRKLSEEFIEPMIVQGGYIPFRRLMTWHIQKEKNPQKVTIFYFQSLSIIDFLISQYGFPSFARLCRYLRDGKNFDQAFQTSYPSLKTLERLEKGWLNYKIKNLKVKQRAVQHRKSISLIQIKESP